MKKIIALLATIFCLFTSVFALDWSNPLEDVAFSHNVDYSEWQVELKGVNPEWYYKPTIKLLSENKNDFYVENIVTCNETNNVITKEIKSDILKLASMTMLYDSPFVGISLYDGYAAEIITYISPENKSISAFVEVQTFTEK